LLPPLEQAPDQITLRSFVALRVIDVPVVNVDEPVLPTATLMPAGLEVTRSPLRPVAVTDTVADWAGGAGGVTDSVTVRVALPAVPVSVTDVVAVTAVVAMPKFALIAPPGTVTLAGTLATAGLLLDRVTATPLAELVARTRQKSSRAGRPVIVAWDTLTV